MESKYNLLTRLLKNIKNVVNPDGSIAGGGSGGVLVVHETVTEEDGQEVRTLDTTYADIVAAGFCVLEYSFLGRHMFKSLVGYGTSDLDGEYLVLFGNNQYSTDSENGYPTYIHADPESH